MPLVQVNLSEDAFSPTGDNGIVTKLSDAVVSINEQNGPSWAWADIENLLSDEWEIGGPARATDAIRALAAGE